MKRFYPGILLSSFLLMSCATPIKTENSLHSTSATAIATQNSNSGQTQTGANTISITESVPACYARRFEALQSLIENVERKVEKECPKGGIISNFELKTTKDKALCRGFEMQATLTCL